MIKKFLVSAATTVAIVSVATAEPLEQLSSSGGSIEQGIILTNPTGELPELLDFKEALETSLTPLCDADTNTGCVELVPLQNMTFFQQLPKNCQLAPCLAGCPGAANLMCAPPLMRTTTMSRASSVHFDDAVQNMSFFDAEGGGEVGVFTMQDGSHEAYFVSKETGFTLIEAGGGGGGHRELLDDIRAQWAAN